ncbi:ABC transporter substrate-binding protein [Paenibacillus sp. S150]|uniref:ABC transporter substrate-binding protein n=1 Tax=Paenibacillus sp. S150 TaxID=2749826 RepID=UPI001C56BED7|nr:ABC transporter substrate-binding protein [Paenibacillus sp. S150]MBW4082567.1 ABC transporter substrate-binding protein [Paenibacillus sp. S150]
MWNTSRKAMLILLSSLMLLITACGSGQNAKVDSRGDSGELKKVVLRLKWIHQAQFAGFYTAVEKGYYKEAGLDVEIRPGGSDFPSVQMVASGSEEFGVTGADQIVIAREKGVPVKALSTIYRKTPFVMFALKESGIATMEDLVGKKVGIKLGGNEELTFRAMEKSAGIEASEIGEMPIKYDLSPLLSGQVQAWPGYVINEVLAVQEQGKEVNIIDPNDYGINFYADTLFTTESVIEKDPEMVKSFVQASMKGWDYALKNPEEAAEFGLKYGDKLELEHEVNMMKASIPLLVPDQLPLGSMEEEAWDTLQKSLIELDFLKKEQDLKALFTNEYLE